MSAINGDEPQAWPQDPNIGAPSGPTHINQPTGQLPRSPSIVLGVLTMASWVLLGVFTFAIVTWAANTLHTDATSDAGERGLGLLFLTLLYVLTAPVLALASATLSAIWHVQVARSARADGYRASVGIVGCWFVPACNVIAPFLLGRNLIRQRAARGLTWLWAASTALGIAVVTAAPIAWVATSSSLSNGPVDKQRQYATAATQFDRIAVTAAVGMAAMMVALAAGVIALRRRQQADPA